MKKIFLLVGALTATAAGLAWCNHLPTTPITADAAATATPASQRPDATHTVQSGTVGAGDFGPLLARTQGRVKALFFTDGDYVRQGQLLVKLDNHTFVLAPRAGFVGTVEVGIGQYISKNTRITTLSGYRYLVVPLTLPRAEQQRLHPGDSARVWAAGAPGRSAGGVLRARPAGAAGDSVLEVVLSSRASFRLGELASARLVLHQ